uniref:3'(2'),5'-bisphosphate nucleotidase n=2 Tax=Schizophyllum commune (strain H4-8 / FGSC 9210) TaxID=578458 RepID=D8QMG5_SCHCM
MSQPYEKEAEFAVCAVRRACNLTASVFNKLIKNETLVKGDKSPVTVGDFSAQALVCTMLANAFPDDLIVGEEDSADLRQDTAASRALKDRIVELANEALTADLALGDKEQWGIGPGKARTPDQLLDAIDRGNYDGGRTGRMWTLDPIDGTKGFLRGGQYAVCLALIVDGEVKVGAIGCPNLHVDAAKPDGEKGCIFVAVRGRGAQQYTLAGADPQPLRLPVLPTSQISFLESVEAAHADHGFNARVSEVLGVTLPPVRMDSQAKYCCLARGEGGAYLRMPVGTGYREKIWDHAPGSVLVEEAGGTISDSRGKPLDFGLGRTLRENFGKVIEAVQTAVSEGLAKFWRGDPELYYRMYPRTHFST